MQDYPEMQQIIQKANLLSGKEEKIFWRKWNVELLEKVTLKTTGFFYPQQRTCSMTI